MNTCTASQLYALDPSLNQKIDEYIIDELKLNAFGDAEESAIATVIKNAITQWEQFRKRDTPSVKTNEREVWRSEDGTKRMLVRGSGASRLDGLYVHQINVEGEWTDAA